jgi:flagella basal body P-ring formation protein FlgA
MLRVYQPIQVFRRFSPKTGRLIGSLCSAVCGWQVFSERTAMPDGVSVKKIAIGNGRAKLLLSHHGSGSAGASPTRKTNGMVNFSRQFARLVLTVAMLFFAQLTNNLIHAQQIPAWREPNHQESASFAAPSAMVRVAIREQAFCHGNIIELSEVAELSGPESLVQSLNSLALGPAPMTGKIESWSQDDLLRIIELKGFDTKQIRWAGADACTIERQSQQSETQIQSFTTSSSTPATAGIAERTVTSVILAYLQMKAPGNAGWKVQPKIPSHSQANLTQRRSIVGIQGGQEPWTGEQKFMLLVQLPKGREAIEILADVQLPPLIWAVTGPISKGRILGEKDLKLVRLSPSMRAQPEDCFEDAKQIVGRELRRNLSSGQPILRSDIGTPRVVKAKDTVKVQVIAGSIVAETVARALQEGGVDDVIEVEVTETKKRLAARVVSSELVEVIAR